MTKRCEPAENMRLVWGRHWLERASGPFIAIWKLNRDNWEYEWYLEEARHFVSAESETAMTWTYQAPVSTPAEIAALRAEIGRLRAVVRVNSLRAGATHAEIDAVLDDPA